MPRAFKIFLLSALILAIQSVEAKTLDTKSQLEDIVMGDPEAPNTIIEYFSLTCGQCAKFHANVLPKIKKHLIDTGKAKFISRDFPLNNLAILAHMVSRCAPRKYYRPYVTTLFKNFSSWTRKSDPVAALKQIAKLGGMGSEKFDSCLKNEELYQGMRKKMSEYTKKFGIDSTPTIIVNGEKVDGDYSSIEKIIDK